MIVNIGGKPSYIYKYNVNEIFREICLLKLMWQALEFPSVRKKRGIEIVKFVYTFPNGKYERIAHV